MFARGRVEHAAGGWTGGNSDRFTFTESSARAPSAGGTIWTLSDGAVVGAGRDGSGLRSGRFGEWPPGGTKNIGTGAGFARGAQTVSARRTTGSFHQSSEQRL